MAILLALCLLTEAAVRVGLASWAGESFQSLSFYRWSPYGLVRNNPSLTSPAFKISANGFRAITEYESAKPEHTFRVLLMGGSVLYSGLGGPARLSNYGRVSSAETIAPFLQEKLEGDPAFADFRIEVINTSLNFNRIVEVSSSYLEEYVHWSPDFVVVFGSINNFKHVRYRGDFEGHKTILQTPHVWRAEFERLVNDTSLSAWLERGWRGAGEHSAALAVASKGLVKLANKLVGPSQRALAPPSSATPPELESAEESNRYFDLYAFYADAMIAAAQRLEHGIAFVWEPLLADLIGVKALSEEEARIAKILQRDSGGMAQFEASRLRFGDFFESQNVPHVDPTERMKTHDQTVFIDYAHYTQGGNEFIADVVYERLRPDLLKRLRSRQMTEASAALKASSAKGIGHTSCLPAQRPSLGVMLNP
ncbi:MAG TPA: hypothetical protein EYG54_04935 [Myxococcales bacterium]|nr:hypothetical protein [Myxococcales bacterium]